MTSGTFSMILNLDGYTSLDGWLTLRETKLVAGDRNYAVTGSMADAQGTLSAMVSIRPSSANRATDRFDFKDVRLEGRTIVGGFALHGQHEGVDIELRLRGRH